MAVPAQHELLPRVAAVTRFHSPVEVPGAAPEPLPEDVVLVVLPPVPPRCPRLGHRMVEGATYCLACRALGLWPRLDRRKLGRAAPDLDRIARLAERRTSLDLATIRGMLTREL